MTLAEALLDLRRVPGVLGFMVLDRSGAPRAGEGVVLESKPTQLSIAGAVSALWACGGAHAARPQAMYVRYSRLGIFTSTYAHGTLAVVCAPDVSLGKVRFAATVSLGRLALVEGGSPVPAAARPRVVPHIARATLSEAAGSLATPSPDRRGASDPPTPPATPKRKTKLGIWD